MYPFPPKEQIAFLVGDTIGQICLGSYVVSFSFESRTSIHAEYAIEYVSTNGTGLRCDVQKLRETELLNFHQCLGKKVIDIAVSELRLAIFFEGGGVLYIYSDLGPYESGHIGHHSDRVEESVFIVF